MSRKVGNVQQRTALVWIAILSCTLFLAAHSYAADCGCTSPKHSVADRIVNGTNVPASQFPTVGRLGDASFNFCTGTLISPRHVLSAAHCVTDDNGRPNLDPAEARFRLGGVAYHVAQILVHPTYTGNIDIEGEVDLAILVLDQPVPNVTPSALFRDTPTTGTLLTLAGFGVTGTGATGANGPPPKDGTIDFGTTPIDEVTSTFVKWVFEKQPPPTVESNTAPGDSGGPAFITVGDQLLLAGVTSGGSNHNAGFGDHSFDTRVDMAVQWIDAVVARDPGGAGTAPIKITSGPTATPESASPFTDIIFTCAASDSLAMMSWDFGDGSPLVAGNSVTHVFANAGTYAVKVTASLGMSSDSVTLNVLVLEDGGGQLTTSRAHFVLNFRLESNSSFDFHVSHPDFIFTDKTAFSNKFDRKSIVLFIGNTQVDDLELFGTKGIGSGTLSWNTRKGELSYKIKSGKLPELLDPFGAHNGDISQSVLVPFALRVDGKAYRGSYNFAYKARADTSGTGK